MTEAPKISWWTRHVTWNRPRIIKVRVYPGRMRDEAGGWTPPSYDEWILAWGGKWRWRIRRDGS